MQKDSNDHNSAAKAAGKDRYFDLVAGDPKSGLVLLCDHASNHIPPIYKDLGLPPQALERHIAYDIGAGAVTRGVAKRLRAMAVLGRFSRLLIDPNRGLDDPTLVMRLSDRTIIPGNRDLDEVERDKRIETFHRPYHRAVSEVLDGLVAMNIVPVVISIHSFTAAWAGKPRPWHAAVLSDTDRRIAGPLIDALRQDGELVVGDNEPYSGALKGDTMWRHGTKRGLPHALIEIRQDLIRDESGQQAWVERLAAALMTVIADFRTRDHS